MNLLLTLITFLPLLGAAILLFVPQRPTPARMSPAGWR